MIKYLFTFIVCFPSLSQTINEKHELLWEISGNGLKQNSYLFGSLHSNDKRLFNLSDSTYYALQKANIIALETDIFSLFDTWDTRKTDVVFHYDNEGTPYITTSEPTETYYGNEDGMPQFLDAFFQQYCYNAGKKFVPLESVNFQLNLFSDIHVPDMNEFNIGELFTSSDEMINLYLEGDIYRIDDLLKTSLSLYSQGYKALIVDRNIKMAQQIDSLVKLNDDILFCTVGAGHLASGSGLINILRGKGYNLRKVMASYNEAPSIFKMDIFGKNNYMYQNDSIGLHVKFPGMPKTVRNENEDYLLKLIYRDFGQGNTYDVEIYNRTEGVELEELANAYIASPIESPFEKLSLDTGGEAYEGLADSYPEGLYWTRVIMNEDYFVVLKSYGGNKFMNSKRAHKFFENTWLE